MKIRLGLPLLGGQLVEGAKVLKTPVLVSANAARKGGKWRLDYTQLEGLDVALDSAGFVAWAHYGGFPWSLGEYLDLVSRHPWAWWAQMDACCEAEIATDRAAVEFRMMETARLWTLCSDAARAAGISQPMPVLQGRTPADYLRSLAMLERRVDRLPPFVGVGSMCRREVGGYEGLISVVDTLDRALPAHAQLHLFGVKGSALSSLSSFGGRVESIDSMAWDVAARRRAHRESASCSMDLRVEEMGRWLEAQGAALKRPRAVQIGLGLM